MSKPITRECPQCHEMKYFRADQKTCGCSKPVATKAPITESEAYLKSEVRRLNSELGRIALARGYKDVLREDLLSAIKAIEPLPPAPYKEGKKAESKMAAVFKASDWHIGAKSTAAETEGFGEFNWDLAQERVQYLAEKFLGWVETHRQSFRIPRCYILSEGDMVSGNIHYELEVTNEFPVPVQAVNAGNLFAKFVAMVAPHFPEVYVSEINIDNHSRLTRRLQFAQGGENSWQYVVHGIANARLDKHKNVNIIEHKGIRGLVDVNGIKILTEHGHTIKAWQGVPFYGMERLKGKEATKRMQAMLEQERNSEVEKLKKEYGFDYMSVGHWHVPSIISNSILINGCLPGTTEFDHACGRYAKPSQVSFMVHPKYGMFDWTAFQCKR